MSGMSIIVKVITRLTLGLILLIGFYIFVFARISHGVGFAGGLVIALGLLVFVLAFGKETALKRLKYGHLALLRDIFLLIFGALTFILAYTGSALFQMKDFTRVSKLIIIFSNMSLSLMCAACFFLIFMNLINFKKEKHL